jgi:hypothetical protein
MAKQRELHFWISIGGSASVEVSKDAYISARRLAGIGPVEHRGEPREDGPFGTELVEGRVTDNPWDELWQVRLEDAVKCLPGPVVRSIALSRCRSALESVIREHI